MTDHANTDRPQGDATASEPEAIESIEAYETEDGVVFYDARNPLAWLQASATVTLREHA